MSRGRCQMTRRIPLSLFSGRAGSLHISHLGQVNSFTRAPALTMALVALQSWQSPLTLLKVTGERWRQEEESPDVASWRRTG